jgi:hypothetical protein
VALWKESFIYAKTFRRQNIQHPKSNPQQSNAACVGRDQSGRVKRMGTTAYIQKSERAGAGTARPRKTPCD